MGVHHGDQIIMTAGMLTATTHGILIVMIRFITIHGITVREFLFG